MNKELKDYFKKYLKKQVFIRKLDLGKVYFYNGEVIAVFDNQLVLDDQKVGQVIFSFDVIQSIEERKKVD
jgi:hypothetical protein